MAARYLGRLDIPNMIAGGLGSPPSALPGISPTGGEIESWRPSGHIQR
ncbi:hypothetical protein AGRO_3609 [Agrobacterium sp. ATCC 31749]|nr:hypothetical protein AGRO_3609 [Agrobacterium sp. ATCC 31749]